MTDAIIRAVDNINWNVGQWMSYIKSHDTTRLDAEITESVQNRLIYNFVDAMDGIEEYETGPLREHLIDMLFYGPHIITKNGVVIQLFDITYAGNYADVKAGQLAAGADFNIAPDKRSIGWKIIYDAANHGIPARKYWKAVNDETYMEIIQARLAFWGNKAPYWIFVEYGTAAGDGPGSPYPSFSGKSPLHKTSQDAIILAEQSRKLWEESIEETLAKDVDETFVEHRTDVRIIHGVIESVAEIKWGKAFVRGKHIVQQAHGARGEFTGKYRIIGPAE